MSGMLHWFTKADHTADVVVRWGGLYLVVTSAFSWLNRQLPWFSGLGWPEIIFIAVWMALLAVFLMAASLAAIRYFRPLPQPTLADGEIEPPTPFSWDDPKLKLTGAERERASVALSEIVDFATSDARQLYDWLNQADSAGPWAVIRQAGSLEPARESLSRLASELWHKHSYYLELMNFDMMPLLQTLEALKNPLEEAAEAESWPVNAQADRARPVAQLMSDLGGQIGTIRKDAAEKRREYLE